MKTQVAVDQSYEEAGLAVTNSFGKVLCMESIRFPATMCRSERRKKLAYRVVELVQMYGAERVIVEKVRLFSSQRTARAKQQREDSGKSSNHISLPVIVAHSRIIGTIIDVLEDSDLKSFPVFSIDTQVWKNAVLGNRSATKDDAVWFVEQITGKRVNHNIADAVCLGLCGWNTRIKQNREW